MRRQLSASTHREAFSALLFLYTKVLGMPLPGADNLPRPQPKRRLPVALSRDELAAVFGHLSGQNLLLAQLLYGTGLRISEGLRLRAKDLDFAHRTVIVREGKGGKDLAGPPSG